MSLIGRLAADCKRGGLRQLLLLIDASLSLPPVPPYKSAHRSPARSKVPLSASGVASRATDTGIEPMSHSRSAKRSSQVIAPLCLVVVWGFAACRETAPGAVSANDGPSASARASAVSTAQRCRPSSIASGAVCAPRQLPPSNATSASGCKSDAECTAGEQGRCVRLPGAIGDLLPTEARGLLAGPPPPPKATVCLYDECKGDVGCGAGRRCVCGGPETRNTCFPADQCLTDADCPKDAQCHCGDEGSPNQCRESTCRVDGDCSDGLPCVASRGGMFCRTKRDTCEKDKDCGGNQFCAWTRDVRAWTCIKRAMIPPG